MPSYPRDPALTQSLSRSPAAPPLQQADVDQQQQPSSSLAPLPLDSVCCLSSHDVVVPLSLRPHPPDTAEQLGELYEQVNEDVTDLVAALVLQNDQHEHQVTPPEFKVVSASGGYTILCERRAPGTVQERWEWMREGEHVEWASCRWRVVFSREGEGEDESGG